MSPVTGKPQLGGEEAGDVANHEKGRPPDEIYEDYKMDTSWGEEVGDVANLEKGRPPDEIYEDDRMDTSSRQFPSVSMSKSTKIFDKDSEQLGPFALRKGKRKLDYEETYPHFPDGFQSEDEEIVEEESADAMGPGPSDTNKAHDDSKNRDNLPQTPIWVESLAETQALHPMEMGEKKYPKWQPGKSEHTFQPQRARLVHGTWVSIENVRKISSSLLVNKPQCEHIADHFEVIGDVLQKLGLGKGFVSGEVLEGGSDIQTNLTFDETRFNHIAETFKKLIYFRETGIRDWSRKFQEYFGELPAMDCSSEESLSKQSKINEGFQDYSPLGMSTKEIVEARSGYRVQHRLDEFLCLLFEVLKHGEDLVLFHSGLEGANNGVVERTGMSGEKFVQIHELLYKLLNCYACLKHCEGTEFASGYLSRPDVCEAESILYYWNSNFLQENASLVISDNFLNIEMATRIAKLLKGPNCALKKLSIESWPGVKVDQEELRKCRLMIIAALSKCESITSLTVRGSYGEEIQELCKSLPAIRVLENLVISTDERLADNDAMDLSAMLKEHHSLKSFTLEFDDVSPEGIDYMGAMLAESSLDEIYLRSRGFSTLYFKYLLGLSMAYIDEERDVILSVEDHHSFFKIRRSVFEGRELPTGESNTQQLRIHKTLNRLSIKFTDLNPDIICEILDSLKKNKTLQVLELESWPRYGRNHGDNHEVSARLEECKVFDDPQVKVAFIDLLVNYNFTLSTISLHGIGRGKNVLGLGQNIETFMETELKLDTDMALRELWSLVCTTSDSPIADSEHDLKQAVGTLQLEEGEGSTKEVCGSSKRAFDKHKSEVEAKDERPRLFLSYSKEMRDFALLLCKVLKSSNYNVVDQYPINLAEVVDQCQLAIVILSDMYVNSKPSMSELCTIVKSKRTNNPTLKVYPLFYKLTLQDLQNAYVSTSTFGGEGSSLDITSEREALNFLCEGKNEVSRKANDLVENLGQGRVDVGKFCEQFSELQRRSWPSNGLEFEKNAISEEVYLCAILEEIFHYMPVVEECNSDQISGHQGKLEMESKLSLRQMKPLLESLPMRDFYLLRKFNMAQFLQGKYIKYSSFEEMCLHLSPKQKDEYSKGRIVAALFPTTFLYHFKVHMFQGPYGGNFRPMLKVVADLVAQKVQKECNQNGVQTSMFFDFVDFGAPVDPRRTIAMCQNFPAKTSNGSKQLIIVQDDLTGAYYYQCDEVTDLGNPALNESIGVIGVQVTSKEIHVDNIHEDGSSYSGVLGDFSYNFDFDENKQCAAKAFGDLPGAGFLSKNSGIKCSPLLVIALASAIQKKGLTLIWRNGKGHMEFYPKLAQKVEVEASACQIQYTGNINQLGLEIEWGTGTNSCTPHNQTFQRGTNEIANQQVIGSNVDQSVGTSGSRDDGTANVLSAMNMQNDIALYSTTTQNKITRSGGIQILGNAFNFSYETHDSETKQVIGEVFQDIRNQRYASKGGFYKNSTLDDEYPDLENRLLRCQLHEVHDHNYLVVYNVHVARHISIYEAIEQNGAVPKFELTWISDIPIDGGEVQMKHIFETGLKGRELIVRREGSNFSQVGDPSKPLEMIVPGYQESLLKFRSRFASNAITTSMKPILVPNLVGMLKSKNEWVHIIGPQAKYEASYKYWWNATPTEAIVYSRTMYTSGALLTTRTELPFDGIDHIGYCSVEEGLKKLNRSYDPMVSRGKFSRPPGSLLGNKVLWGGLEIELENLSVQ